MIDEAGPICTCVASSPASTFLFEVNPNSTALPKKDADRFHTFVAKLLFVSKRARPDILTAVAFLTTRVKSPDTDDNSKLTRVIKYLQATPKLHLTLQSNSSRIMKWRVDGSFGVHNDLKSHTGGTFTMGKGSIYSSSTRQKLNTRSSTEAELVAVDDLMPQILWTRLFLASQGYRTTTTLFQDNMSAMQLENNGRKSCGKRTRHLNIRFFFVTDRIKAGDLSVVHEPTGDMVADFFTKPLQGSIFRRFRKIILNE